MMGSEILETVLLGIVQGIAEFLPISSSGHLVICGELLARFSGRPIDPEGNLQMNVALHVGTLGSILWVYRSELRALVGRRQLCVGIVVATIPLVIVGLTLRDWFERVFQTPLIAGCGLLVTAAMLWLGQKLEREEHELDGVSPRRALTVGLFQAFALVPGISRSGSTIAGGLLTGMRREAATTFSFLIAIPAILGAATLEGKKIWENGSVVGDPVALVLGMLTAFLVGVVALRWLLRIVSERKLHWFAAYCLTVGLATIVWQVLAPGS
jgi:undecaprenyl-diphosphatase